MSVKFSEVGRWLKTSDLYLDLYQSSVDDDEIVCPYYCEFPYVENIEEFEYVYNVCKFWRGKFPPTFLHYLNENKLECLEFLKNKKEFQYHLNILFDSINSFEEFKQLTEIHLKYSCNIELFVYINYCITYPEKVIPYIVENNLFNLNFNGVKIVNLFDYSLKDRLLVNEPTNDKLIIECNLKEIGKIDYHAIDLDFHSSRNNKGGNLYKLYTELYNGKSKNMDISIKNKDGSFIYVNYYKNKYIEFITGKSIFYVLINDKDKVEKLMYDLYRHSL